MNWIFIANPNRSPNKDAKTERGLNPASNTPHITYNKQTNKTIHWDTSTDSVEIFSINVFVYRFDATVFYEFSKIHLILSFIWIGSIWTNQLKMHTNQLKLCSQTQQISTWTHGSYIVRIYHLELKVTFCFWFISFKQKKPPTHDASKCRSGFYQIDEFSWKLNIMNASLVHAFPTCNVNDNLGEIFSLSFGISKKNRSKW